MKEKIKSVFHLFFVTAGIMFLVFAGMYHSSCRITPEGITLVDDGEHSPKITDFSCNGKEIEVVFTKEVFIEDTFAVEADEKLSSIENFLNCDEKIQVHQVQTDRAKTVKFLIDGETKIGKYYELYGCVKDKKGNTLSFTIPFLGENNNFPVIVISEVNESYSKKDCLYEYVELYAATSGNLFGLEIISASDGKVFSLPAVDVHKGEYILVHLRSPENEEQAVSELSDDLNLSKAKGSVSNARDIWIENYDSVLNSTADIVILNNKAKNQFIDCVMYCKRSYPEENSVWKNDNLNVAAQKCIDLNLWQGDATPSSAVFSEQRESISYISRKNLSNFSSSVQIVNSRSVWEGTTKSKMTPGKPNTCNP